MTRTHGRTTTCAGCRFWSEMIAKAEGGGQLMAMCLASGGPMDSQYTTGGMTCVAWKSGHFGAIDDPPNYGEETRATYIDEEGRDACRPANIGEDHGTERTA